jgi:gliding motility-associated-like protein
MKPKYIPYLILCLFLSQLIDAQNMNSFVQTDIFQSAYFIENHGQYHLDNEGNNPILYGVENKKDLFYFQKNGMIINMIPLEKAHEKQREEREEREEAEEFLPTEESLAQKIQLTWIGCNEHLVIEPIEKSVHYFTYGNSKEASYGYKKIIYKELYPNIDLEYIIPDSGGVKYTLKLKPGFHIEDIRFTYHTKKISIRKGGTEIRIKTIFEDLMEKNLLAFDVDGHNIDLQYALHNDTISFVSNAPIDNSKLMYIDPWVTAITSLTSSSSASNQGYDVDYDVYGNLYVYGGGKRSFLSPENFKVAKYNSTGTLLWTFNGNVSSIAWDSKGNGGDASNFCVNKFDEKIYIGQGYYAVGTRLVRLNRLGFYDAFTNFPLTLMKEMWELKFNCNNGDVFVYGGGPTSNNHIGKLDTTTTDITITSFTGNASFDQDVVCAAIDRNNDMFVIMSSETLPIIDNHIYKLNSTRTGFVWNVFSGYGSFVENTNKPYYVAVGQNSNSFNALFAANYLFYYDGLNLKAFDKNTGASIGSPYVIPGHTLKQQGGIFADECNNVYVGGYDGNIKTFYFDGFNFIPQSDIIIPGAGAHAVFDVDYNVSINQLCISGNAIVANMTPTLYCSTVDLSVSVTHVCPNILIANISPALSSEIYSFTWFDSTTNVIVQSLSNTNHVADTNLVLFPERTYGIVVTKDVRCGLIVDTLYFIYHCCVADSITTHTNLCPGQTLVVGVHTYSTPGIYRDTLLSSRSCDSIVISYLTFDTPFTYQSRTTCLGDTLFVGNIKHYATGVYIDTLPAFGLCDSVVTSSFTFSPLPIDTLTFTICSSHPVVIGSHTYSSAGTYRDTLTSHLGCDSIIVSQITASLSSATTIDTILCSGYILVGSHFYFTSGTYIDTLLNYNGCDSIVITNLLTNLSTYTSISVPMCAGDTIRLNDSIYTSPGFYLQNFINIHGCDSVISVFIRASSAMSFSTSAAICAGDTAFWGSRFYDHAGTFRDTIHTIGVCDTILTMTIFVLPLTNTRRAYSLCPYDTLHIGIHHYYTSGTYYDTFNRIGLCDSVHRSDISISSYPILSISAQLCFPDTFIFNSRNYYSSGIFNDTIPRIGKCDSIVSLNILVTYAPRDSQYINLCIGDTAHVNAHSYTTEGIYADTILRGGFCDSFVITRVETIPMNVFNQTISICFGDTFFVHGHAYANAATYLDTISRIGLCDSFVQTTLLILPRHSFSQNIALCAPNSYSIGMHTYSISGTYRDSFINAYGCDSIIITNLTIHVANSSVLNEIRCIGDSLAIGTHKYATTGDYEDTLTTIFGCDSFVSTHLMVYTSPTLVQFINLCYDSSYSIATHVYATSGTYTDTLRGLYGCDSIVETHLMIQTRSILNTDTIRCSGDAFLGITIAQDTTVLTTLKNIFGCDSIVHIYHIKALAFTPLTLSPDTSICLGDTLLLRASGGFTNQFIWLPDSSLACLNCPFTTCVPHQNNTYFVTTQNCLGEIIQDSIYVTVHLPTIASILNIDTSLYIGQSINLNFFIDTNAPPIQSAFLNTLRVFCQNCDSYNFLPTVSSFYFLTTMNEYGCVYADSILILVNNDCNIQTIETPNYFTPNKDGFNDFFFIKNPNFIPIVKIEIYDRWGEMVFSTNNEKDKWDGTFMDTNLPPGVYIYQIKTNCISAENNLLFGNITLIR